MIPAKNHNERNGIGGILPTLKVPSQYSFVLLVELRLKEGKALGSEGHKGLGIRFCYEQRKGVE
jgi:hypothetical protein